MESTKKLVEENERMRKVISVYAADKQAALSEQLNKIAAQLKAEYRDFKDAQDMEMDVNLGENFRIQLESVFKILIKAGVNLE